jgi:hypothetical protein
VLGRLEQHLFEVHPVGGLDLGPLGDRRSGAAQPLREPVANPLELPQIEQSRLTRRAARAREPAHREGGHERRRKLTLEPFDLRPERASRGALVLDERRCDSKPNLRSAA